MNGTRSIDKAGARSINKAGARSINKAGLSRSINEAGEMFVGIAEASFIISNTVSKH